MAVVGKTVNKIAGVDGVIAIPVGKKIYGFCRMFGFDAYLSQNGIEYRLANSALAEFYFHVPMEFAASASIIFRGSGAGTPSVLMDE